MHDQPFLRFVFLSGGESSLILLLLLPSCDALWEVCVDSAVGLDGVPYSLFKVPFPWWQSALLDFFNLILSWSAVPAMWKRSIVVPVLKRGDASVPTNYRPISLASCCFKLFEHLILHRIGPHISSQLDQCQGGFRWDADVLVSSSRRRPFLPQFHPHVRRFRGHPESV